jgi:beta-glucanase (GH16 family)
VHGTAHWGSSWNVHQYSGESIQLTGGQTFSEQFHLFSVEWQEDEIKWYMDDQLYYSISPNQMNGQPYPFNASFFLIMNIAVGGDWPGYPDASTSFPQEMVIDCVRVFQ